MDETGALAPVSERGRWRVAAEAAWLASGLPVHLFRLAGIYGPGRSALDKLREGRAHRVVKPGQVFSRIHVDDIAGVLAGLHGAAGPGAGLQRRRRRAGAAAGRDRLRRRSSSALPVPPEVPFAAAELSPMARSFYGESKRVANRRIKEELGVRLAWPDYRAGLAAILAAGF